MGTDYIYHLGSRQYKSEELSAFWLKKMISDAEEQLGTPVADTSYCELEQDVKFIGERFSSYVYRNILDMPDKVLVDRNALSQVIAWGFANEHRSRLYDICHCIPRSGPNAAKR